MARRDITPPLDIYARNWGAAQHDMAQSVHRPLTLTVLTMATNEAEAEPLALVSLDLGWWRSAAEEKILRETLRKAGIAEGRGILALSHTHAGPVFSPALAGQPGGQRIPEYLHYVCRQIREALAEALLMAVPGVWESATGTCPLAQNRDMRDPQAPRYIVGWNPEATADQTLMVGRVSDAGGRCLATLVNYACHPTILAWENTALSPDFVGAMREIIELETEAPCLFLQGASGELAPRHQYVSDPEIADRAGRCLGHAALSVLHHLPSPGCELAFDGVVESGAPLAVWKERTRTELPEQMAVRRRDLDLLIREDLPSAETLKNDLASCGDHALQERLHRKLLIRQSVGDQPTYPVSLLLWRLGEILVVAIPNEAYSAIQQDVRKIAGALPVFFITLANGGCGYLVPEKAYDEDLYAMWQSPFARGSWEKCRDGLGEEIRRLAQ